MISKQAIQKKLLIGSLVLLIALLSGMLLRFLSFNHFAASEQATTGLLDLSRLPTGEGGLIKLNGEWEFYWEELLTPADFTADLTHAKKFIQVPALWSDYDFAAEGYGTYRLVVRVPADAGLLGLQIPPVYTAHKLWINGNLVSQDGKVTASPTDGEARHYSKFIPVQPIAGKIELVCQVSNFMHSKNGLWRPFVFGDYATIAKEYTAGIIMDILVFGVLMAMGLFYLTFFLIRNQERTALYFGLFCLMVSLRSLVVGNILLAQFFGQISQEAILRLEYLTFYIGMAMYTCFMHQLLPAKIPKIVLNTVMVFSMVNALLVLTPPRFFTRILVIYEVFAILLLIYLLYAMGKAVREKSREARFLLLSNFIWFVTVVNDILYYSDLSPISNIYPLGILALIFTQSTLLLKRFTEAFKAVERINERLSEVDKLKDEFLAEVTHELLTPVHGVTGFLDSVLTTAASRLNVAEESSLTAALSINRRLVNLVGDIQDFLKLKHKDIALKPAIVNVNTIAGIVIATCRVLAKGKKLRILNAIDPALFVTADETRLQQILHNLIENSVKYTHAGEIKVEARVSAGEAVISVTDTGIGIPDDKLEDVFNPYVQAHQAVDAGRSYQGSGLGLSITKKLVELQNGKIWAESSIGAGTRITFTLPLGEKKVLPVKFPTVAETECGENAVPSSPHPNGANILIVDDEPVNLSVLEQHLTEQAFAVTKAYGGREALDKVKTGEYDLIILDIMMPDLSGYDVCRHIRKRYSLLELPVLVLTVKSKAENIVLALECGANDYLAKPFDKRELLARVNALVVMKKSLREAIETQRSFLLTQIKPHFLYNVLNTIMGFCIIDPHKAHELLGEFSNFLRSRARLNETSRFIELGDEIAMVLSYLKIEKARFHDRLTFTINITVEQQFPIPPFLLQPLVENAVKHGVCMKPTGGHVTVTAINEGNAVKISVADNGAGMSPAKIREILDPDRSADGVGIKNISKRLQLYYEQRLVIESSPGEGTTVWFIIPREKR